MHQCTSEPHDQIDADDTIIPSHLIRNFLSAAYPSYQSIKTTEDYIRIPIMLYVSSQSVDTVEERFTLLFRSLEGLVAHFSKQTKMDRLLTQKQIKSIRRSVEVSLDLSRAVAPMVLEKIGELRRATFQRKLLFLLKEKKIILDDIGGEQGIRRIIQTRNRLIHALDRTNVAAIAVEAARLETIFERITICILNWRRDHHTPTRLNRNLLEMSELTCEDIEA